jgi:site-specific recombinase XerD
MDKAVSNIQPYRRPTWAATAIYGDTRIICAKIADSHNSVHVYLPFIRNFLSAQTFQAGCLSRDAFETLNIQRFLLARTKDRSDEYTRLLATALRSFFRFLFFAGETVRDLARSVPMVRKYRMSAPPSFLSPEQTECVLAATDRTTSTGRRDYAVLLLLARLGLRAGEVVLLELDDIRWRSAEIVICGKGRMLDHLPLIRDVGEALAAYVRDDRGVSSSRRVFLRTWAPRVGLTGPAAVGHIVRKALTRAGVRRSGRGAAHLFRHGLATKMIRRGASIAEIAEVLRHRSQNQEFLKFLELVDSRLPDEVNEVHLVMDNYGTHKTPKVKRWSQRHRRYHLHFTPSSSSWINQIERFFAEITDKRIRRGSFESVRSLEQAICAYLYDHNQDPKPFAWVATADDILAKIKRFCERTSETGH